MHIKIDPSSGVPIYLQIIQEMKILLAGGVLNPGDKLPSVRNLAMDLRINPNTVAKAYNDMEWEGIIFTRRGEGSFVSEKQESLQQNSQIELLKEKIDELVKMANSFGIQADQVQKLVAERLQRKE